MISFERYEKLYEYMKAREHDIIERLADICRIPSVRSESERRDEPYGHECAVCLKECAEIFRKEGFETTVYPEGGYAVVSGGAGRSQRTVCLYAHTDVVPVNEEEWVITKPFEPRIVGNCIVGRGVHDNKNAVIASLYLLKAIRDLSIETNVNFQIFLGSNEESGMGDVKAFVHEQRMPDISIVPDAGYPAAIGQKGILRFNVRSKKPFEDIVTVSGGMAYNTVLDCVTAKLRRSETLLAELEAKRPECITVEDGNFITVTAVGRASHAARAEQGINALGLMANFLLEIGSLSGNDREILAFVSDSLSDVYGENWGIAASNDFFGATTCACGIAKMVNGHLDYTFDVRFGDAMAEAEMLSRIEGYFSDGGFEYKQYSISHCMKSDEMSMPVRTFMEGYRVLTGDHEAKPYVMGGGTYAYHVEGGFAIGVDLRENEKNIELPASHGGAHQADEVLCIPDFIRGIALMTELMLEIDDASDDENQ